jgi:hypothetical protein
MRDGERQHRAERVHVAEEVGLPGQKRHDCRQREHDDPDPRCTEAWVQASQRVRHLPVDAHGVDEP